MKKCTLFFALFLLAGMMTFAQVGINNDNSAPDSSAMLDVKSTTRGALFPRMTLTERNSVANPATGLMVYQTDGVAGLYCFNGTSWQLIGDHGGSSTSHYVGESFGGGMVFYVDNTGQHGLIVSMIDLGSFYQWSELFMFNGAVSTWNGESNSNIIESISPAAQLCLNYYNSSNYGTGQFNDWYLPAIDQLSIIWHNRMILNKYLENISGANDLGNGNQTKWYWSSTENSSNYAWNFNFTSGNAGYNGKADHNWVRAVRAF